MKIKSNFNTGKMNQLKKQSRKLSHLQQLQESYTIPRNKFNQGGKKKLYNENYTTLMKIIEEDTNKKIPHAHGLEEYCQNHKTIQSNLIQLNLYQNIKDFLQINRKKIIRCKWKQKILQLGKAILRQNSKTEGMTLPDFKIHYTKLQ